MEDKSIEQRIADFMVDHPSGRAYELIRDLAVALAASEQRAERAERERDEAHVKVHQERALVEDMERINNALRAERNTLIRERDRTVGQATKLIEATAVENESHWMEECTNGACVAAVRLRADLDASPEEDNDA